jgi:hypothetical protein
MAQKRWPPPLGGDDWQGYMRWRFEDEASEDVVVDASTLDGENHPLVPSLPCLELGCAAARQS